VEVKEEEGFQYLPEMIEESLAEGQGHHDQFPFEPDGKRSVQGKNGADCTELFLIISDEIYHGLVYEGEAHSILEFTDRAFVINGFQNSMP